MSAFASPNMIGGVLFFIALGSGIVLGQMGKPLNDLVFMIHKLIALGTIIALAVGVYTLHKAGGIQTVHVTIFAITGLLLIALFVSGALLSLVAGAVLSLNEPVLLVISRVHQIVPVLALVASVMSVYLLVSAEA